VNEEGLVVEEDHEEGRVGPDPLAQHAPERNELGEREFDLMMRRRKIVGKLTSARGL